MAEVHIADLSVRFGGVQALSGVTLTVTEGAVHAVVGPNGAGKSTLLNAINGFVPISEGTVSLQDERVDRRSAAEIAKLGVRRSFQNPRLVETLSVSENLTYGMYDSVAHSWVDQIVRPWRSRADEQEAQARGMELLHAANLEGDAEATVASLPYGVKKVVEILRALMPRPRILLLDEPSSGLSTTERQDLSTMLKKQLADLSTTVVVVEHHMDVVKSVATHVTVLKAGRVAETGSLNPPLIVEEREEVR